MARWALCPPPPGGGREWEDEPGVYLCTRSCRPELAGPLVTLTCSVDEWLLCCLSPEMGSQKPPSLLLCQLVSLWPKVSLNSLIYYPKSSLYAMWPHFAPNGTWHLLLQRGSDQTSKGARWVMPRTREGMEDLWLLRGRPALLSVASVLNSVSPRLMTKTAHSPETPLITFQIFLPT